jgi:hypothetical protein
MKGLLYSKMACGVTCHSQVKKDRFEVLAHNVNIPNMEINKEVKCTMIVMQTTMRTGNKILTVQDSYMLVNNHTLQDFTHTTCYMPVINHTLQDFTHNL